MQLEAASNPCWPLFFTLTYSDENLPSLEEASGKARRFPQYIRRRGFHIRYFLCTELGDQTARVHHHGVCWIPEWDQISSYGIDQIKEKVWPYGFSDFSRVRKVGAFRYVAKYVQKQDRFPPGVRGYQWSRRPELGAGGVEMWRDVVLDCRRNRRAGASTVFRVPNRIVLNVLNEPVRIRIPDADVARLSSELGVLAEEPRLNGKLLGDPTRCTNYLRAIDYQRERRQWRDENNAA